MVLPLSVVDNSVLVFQLLLGSLSHESGNYDHPSALHAARYDPSLVRLPAPSPPLSLPQPAPIGIGASGSVSTSRTLQRLSVSPAAIAGVRCR
jgi:hypothetical protein